MTLVFVNETGRLYQRGKSFFSTGLAPIFLVFVNEPICFYQRGFLFQGFISCFGPRGCFCGPEGGKSTTQILNPASKRPFAKKRVFSTVSPARLFLRTRRGELDPPARLFLRTRRGKIDPADFKSGFKRPSCKNLCFSHTIACGTVFVDPKGEVDPADSESCLKTHCFKSAFFFVWFRSCKAQRTTPTPVDENVFVNETSRFYRREKSCLSTGLAPIFLVFVNGTVRFYQRGFLFFLGFFSVVNKFQVRICSLHVMTQDSCPNLFFALTHREHTPLKKQSCVVFNGSLF